MKNKRKFWALILAMSMSVTSITVPVYGAEDVSLVLCQEDESESMDAAVEIAELPDEDGKYVVYMENDRTDEVPLPNDLHELAADSSEVVLETDLTTAQLEQLKELSSQNGEVYVEENVFLMGASSDASDTVGMEETEEWETGIEETGDESDGGDTKEDADCAERLALKHELAEQFQAEENENKEAEWNVQMIHADDVDAEMTGTPVKVAVLDSGVEFLAGIPIEKSINFVKDEQDLPYYMNDMTGHGTSVADIIHQVCPQAQIYSVKVMDRENRGRLSDVVAGIYWCMEQEVDIINMSFGTSIESDILRKDIEAAAEQGIMMVSSAGNGGTGSAVEYPAAFKEVIAVGAVDTSAQKTKESATGEEVELAAPGEQILTKSMLGLETVNSGTSVAAPHVTGAAALLMQQSEYKDADVIRRVLDKGSNPLGDEDAYGYGLVDVAYAAELLSSYEEIVMEESGACDDSGEADEITSGEAGLDMSEDSASQAEMTYDDCVGEVTSGEAEHDISLGTKPEMQMKSEDVAEEEQPIEPETGTESEAISREDALDALEQISRPIETFEEIDYVEGRWSRDNHSLLVENGCKVAGGFTTTERQIFKTGAAYPDQEYSGLRGGTAHPGWHGWNGWDGRNGENYISNFIFATRIAVAGGDTTNLKKADGQKQASYNAMKSDVSISGIKGVSWNEILKEWGYSSKNETKQKRWRQIFLYGMALHTATDAFAHNSCHGKADGSIVYYVEEGTDDDPEICPNRWKCAKNTAYKIALDCSLSLEGEIIDFSSLGQSYWTGFYMGDIIDHAVEANGGKNRAYMEKYFGAVALLRGVSTGRG